MWEQCISHEIVTLCSDCVIFRESARDKQESRVTMQMELEARHREERELEERRLEREHMGQFLQGGNFGCFVSLFFKK